MSLASVKRQDVVTDVSEAWRAYWKSALFIASFYCLNLVLVLAMKGACRVGAWDALMLWYIVDGMLIGSLAALLRKHAGALAGKGEE